MLIACSYFWLKVTFVRAMQRRLKLPNHE
jgi:hypothetical protein